MKLIENWRDWPRMYSQRAFATIVLVQGSVLAFLTPEQLAAPVLFYPALTWGAAIQGFIALLAVTGFIGRLLSQEPPKE